MNKNQVLVLSLSAIISFGGLVNGGAAFAAQSGDSSISFETCIDKNCENISFEDFMKDMPTKDIPMDDMKKLEKLYDECVKLEKADKFDKAYDKWDEFCKILDKYFDEDDKEKSE